MKSLIHDTIVRLRNQEPEQHAETRQNLYDQLDLPFEKQLALYNSALGPASSGKLENSAIIESVVDRTIRLLETPER
ncbi:PAS factor family protein [Vibrio mytili]|uniref:Secretion protein n=1 Tax=Vibrio mytili TaxID=50718 RepID=A0A0C3DKZ9_9VIBR|nr:PAS factor family protein [Vibrio mytili]KIN12099.1 secretion protein [Vibrio mytili]